MKEKVRKVKEYFFYINKFDDNAVWFTITVLIGIVLLAVILYAGIVYTKSVFIPEFKELISWV